METKNIVLPGGTSGQVEKIENTVHRKVKGHPMLHQYLLYLEKEGVVGVPRFLGIDEEGREILSYIPGKTMRKDYHDDHPIFQSTQTICDMARFMRKLHDVSTGFLSKALEGGWKDPYFSQPTYETICHSDAAMWNFVFVNDRVAGLFDFDSAHPGMRAWDLTLILCSSVFPQYEDYIPSKHLDNARQRRELFFEAYGMDCPVHIIELTIFRLQTVKDLLIKMNAPSEALTHCQNVITHLDTHGREWV